MSIRLIAFIALAAIGGAAITVQAGLNAQVARTLGHPLWATMMSLTVSVISILPMLVLFRAGPPTLATISATPWWIWVGGALGALFITVALITAPELGAVVFITAVVTGQMIASLVLDHFAIAGFPERPVSLLRVLGVALVIIGVIVTTLAARASERPSSAGQISEETAS
jgi:transporter family-2 protein